MVDAAASAPPTWATASWGLQRSTRSPQDEGLSTARIVAAAIELADEEGLPALSIRKLGQRLGAGTMAAYRHIDSRDDLVILMLDEALGAPPHSITAQGSWQRGVASWVSAILDRYRLHPWLVDAPISGIPSTPHRALWLEYLLQVLGTTGLTMDRMLGCALLIDGHARNTAYLRREIDRSNRDGRPAIDWLVPLFNPATFPMMALVVAGGELADDSEPTADFGLERIIAGIDVLLGE